MTLIQFCIIRMGLPLPLKLIPCSCWKYHVSGSAFWLNNIIELRPLFGKKKLNFLAGLFRISMESSKVRHEDLGRDNYVWQCVTCEGTSRTINSTLRSSHFVFLLLFFIFDNLKKMCLFKEWLFIWFVAF